MKGRVLIAAAVVAALSLTGGLATNAYAKVGLSWPTRCDALSCHVGPGVSPVVTLASNDGSTAVYNVSNGGEEWAVFRGSTRIAGQPGDTGEFSVPTGATYTVYAVNGYPGPLGVTVVSPDGTPVVSHLVVVTSGANGMISPGTLTVAHGSDLTCSITPDPGYHIAAVTVDSVPVGAVTSYTFDNVTADHTISATFAADVLVTYAITASAGAHGSISPAGVKNVVAGAAQTFDFTSSTGYHVSSVLVDGGAVVAADSYTFTNVRATHAIAVTFAANVYAIDVSAGLHGLASPAGSQNATFGSDVSFTFTADPGYHVADVLVDGDSVGALSSYTLADVREAHSISVTFAVNEAGTFSIAPTAGSAGAISPAEVQVVEAGEDITFTITPDAGSHIQTLAVDGVAVAVTSSYTFANVQADHTIAATFAKDPAPTTCSLSGNHASVKHGKSVKVSSVLRHAGVAGPAALKVRYEVKRPGSKSWILLSTRTTAASGATSYTYKLSKRGYYYFRVRFLGTGYYKASTSKTVKVKSK